MERLESDLIVKNKEDIEQLWRDAIDENCDLIYQRVFFSRDNQCCLINKQFIDELKKEAIERKKREYAAYKDAIDEYHKYLDLIREMLEKLKVRDDILIPILLTKLIEIGFFSADNKFIKKDIPERNLKMFMGIRIILGQGDCKHMSLFYRDIFKNSADHSLIFSGFLDKNAETRMALARKINHVIGLVTHHDTFYGFDFRNRQIFSFLDKYRMQSIDDPNLFMVYKSLYDILFTEFDYDEIRSNLVCYGNNKGILTPDDYTAMIHEVEKIISDNRDYFGSFYRSTHQIKEDIKDKILQR